MESPDIRSWMEGAVGVIELSRPDKFNCLSRQCLEMIGDAIEQFEVDKSVRAVLIRAQGKHFCTGADLEQIGNLVDSAIETVGNAKLAHNLMHRMEASRLPIVAAVQGLALAGGLELVLSCDVVFAAATSRFGDQHAQYGLIPGWGASQRLPHLIGLRRSLDFLLSARWIDAETAERWNLVNYVVADDALHGDAFAYCAMLAKRNPEGLAAMKRLARQAVNGALDKGLAQELEAIAVLLASSNFREGVAAFRERREPQFT